MLNFLVEMKKKFLIKMSSLFKKKELNSVDFLFNLKLLFKASTIEFMIGSTAFY